jgi:uncharacterized membrane protein
MKIFTQISTYLLAALLVLGAYGHIMNPAISDGFIPDFIPKSFAHIVAAVVELSLGIALLFPKTRKLGALGTLVLLSVFLLFFHLIDVFRATPVVGTTTIAVVRVLFQLLFMYMSWVVYKKEP